jgi:glycerol-3-phosphate dehydrogenase subunit B
MNFDCVIIGGGLSGLICGIELQKKHKRCVIVSSGQSALHFSSGSFDLLNTLPAGEPVDKPLEEGIPKLVDACPLHPYARIGKALIPKLAERGKVLLAEAGIATVGSSERNHYRMTPMGLLKPTWLTGTEFVPSANCGWKWKNVALLNFQNFADFYPQFILSEMNKVGVNVDVSELDFSFFKPILQSPSELRAANIARIFDKPEYMEELAAAIKRLDPKYEAVILPACIGLNPMNAIGKLTEMTGKEIKLVATFPPSVSGIYYQQSLRHYFESLGGVYMLGDKVESGSISGNRILNVYTSNHRDIPLKSKDMVLATGSFFSRGLVASPYQVYEPLFHLDVTFDPDRKKWYNPNFSDNHSYQSFGVRTNNSFQGMIDGEAISNLYVSGAILDGFNPLKEGSGAGVSILSALYIADKIKGKN